MFLVEGRDVSSAGYFQESVGNSLIVKLHEKKNGRRPAAVAGRALQRTVWTARAKP